MSGGYTYMPISINTTKAYSSFNIEQQAEMVEDRFRLIHSLAIVLASNIGATLPSLNHVISF